MSHHHHQTATDKTVQKKTRAVKRSAGMPAMLKVLRAGFSLGGRISPTLAGRYAYKLWFTPTRYKTPASEYAAKQSALIERQSFHGNSITTYQWGCTGPTVLLVHGWSGRGTQLGAFVEPLLNAGYRVLSFDAPAHGESSGSQTNLYEIADVILALRAHYGAFEAAITHSFGGPCLTMAMKAGLAITRVVCMAPPANAEGLVKKFVTALAIPEKAEQDLLRRIERKFGKNVWQEISMQSNVRDLNVPALIMHDMDDLDVHWREGESVARAWNNAKFVTTRALGHRRIVRDPATIVAAVDFIKSAAQP